MLCQKPMRDDAPWMQNTATGLAWALGSTLALFLLLYCCLPHRTLTSATAHSPMASGCVSGGDAAQEQCGLMLSEEWYQAGASNVDRAQLVKNNDKCRMVREATIRACKGNDNE